MPKSPSTSLRNNLLRGGIAGATLLLAGLVVSQTSAPDRVGPLPDGAHRIPNGWVVRPVGYQVPVETLPMSSVLTPDGKYLVVLNGGYNPTKLSVVDVATRQEVDRVPVPDGWLGLSFAPNGKKLYVGGGSRGEVFEFDYADGKLAAARTFKLFETPAKTEEDFVGDVAISPDGKFAYVALLLRDTVALVNLQSGFVAERIKVGRRPYRILFHPDGNSFLVSSWADATVYQYKAETGEAINFVRLGQHPTDMIWSARKPDDEEKEKEEGEKPAGPWPYERRLFVAAANTNSVFVVGFKPDREMTRLEAINVAMTPRQPVGMTPSALALSKDEETLAIVCSDANAVAVVDVEERRSRVRGFVPTGWYPTAARYLPDGRMVVLNGRGLRSFPNPKGPNPLVRAPFVRRGDVTTLEYVGRLQKGTLSFIDPFDDAVLADYTKQVYANSPYRDDLLDNARTGEGNPVPSAPPAPGEPSTSPIQHVIYVVKENRTYDQVLGDLGIGNGDPSLAIFGEDVAPNHRKLAREFVLFDNFYVNADVSADGHNWSTSAIANDYVQKLWQNGYGGRRRKYDYEGGEPAALPPAGYLWANARAAGISMRNYGWWAENIPAAEVKGPQQIRRVRDPILAPVTNLQFRAFDLDYKDVDRIKVFLDDLKQFETSGQMPRLMFVRIGNDHTSGLSANKYSPRAAMADNDLALGQLVEALSKSKFWPKTAIFVLEDDAQNGSDHVDSHRSPAYVISPYTRRGVIDSTMYNTTSILRTMELILGLRPMTQFDAAARPMSAAFAKTPNLAPYQAVVPRQNLDERNPQAEPAKAAWQRRSEQMDFSEADRIDDDVLNQILWVALKGSPYPEPRRSIFGK